MARNCVAMHQQVWLTVIIVLFELGVHGPVASLTVQCNTCDAAQCPRVDDCNWGTVMDMCQCCRICARSFNETCGGRFGMLGKCGPSLRCVVAINSGQPVTGHEVGVCKGN